MSAEKLFLIDGHALCYRSFFAIKGLSTSKGQPTNAIYGFLNTLKKILRDYKPQYMAVCFDSKEKTHRQKKFTEYKIQRPVMPDDLISQMNSIKEIVKAYSLTSFECPGFEADDIIASLVYGLKKENLEIVIVSEDKDLYQLANARVKFLSTRRETLWEYEALKEELGFSPDKIVDFIALAGDKVDNIPGVHGIGEVTARNLLKEYGSVADVFKNIDTLTPMKVREKLLAQRELAFLSRDLAQLETKVPLDFNLENLKVQSPNNNRLFELFKEYEFKKLAQELSADLPSSDDASTQNQITLIKNKSDLTRCLFEVRQQGYFVFYLDSSLEAEVMVPRLVLLLGEQMICLERERMAEFQELFEDESLMKVTYNLKEVLKFFAGGGQMLQGKTFDIMLAAYLLGTAPSALELNDLAWGYFKKTLEEKNLAQKVFVLNELYPVLLKELAEKELSRLFEEIEMPLVAVLAKMEMHGVKLDLELLAKLSKECDLSIETLTKRLYNQAGEEFNLNSPKQLGHILFEKLKLPSLKKTKTGFSTNEEVLTQLARRHDFPAFVLEYRQLAKLKSTYIDALPKLVDAKTGRIHADFNQTGTETGRLSSRHPNLQNIPIRTELGQQIRKAIISSGKNFIIIAADYSQIELRILAHLSQDKNLIKAFQEDQDIHQFTASLIFDVKENEVTSEMRHSAKRVNFGIIYGMSAFGLAKDLNISNPQAQEFIDRYFLRYPDVKKFMDSEIEKCEKNGFVSTLLNRRRYIPEINSRDNSLRQFAQRQAINTPVQGSAADLMKLAMININQVLEERKLKTKMVITVHDELVFDAPEGECAEMTRLIGEYMENPLKLSVPITVSIKVGKNWLEMRDVKN